MLLGSFRSGRHTWQPPQTAAAWPRAVGLPHAPGWCLQPLLAQVLCWQAVVAGAGGQTQGLQSRGQQLAAS